MFSKRLHRYCAPFEDLAIDPGISLSVEPHVDRDLASPWYAKAASTIQVREETTCQAVFVMSKIRKNKVKLTVPDQASRSGTIGS